MVSAKLNVIDSESNDGVTSYDVEVCAKCKQHEGQHLVNPIEVQDGADPIMICTICETEADIADLGD